MTEEKERLYKSDLEVINKRLEWLNDQFDQLKMHKNPSSTTMLICGNMEAYADTLLKAIKRLRSMN